MPTRQSDWDRKHRLAAEGPPSEPASIVRELFPILPAGPALDIACGSGRDAVWLALKGYEVEAIDVLPDALERAGDLARRSSMQIRLILQDLERTPILPEARYDVICVFRYLQRTLFPALQNALAPGGFVVCETFHESNLFTGQKPRCPDHLLKTGELAKAFANLQILITQDAVEHDRRFFSRLLARRLIPL